MNCDLQISYCTMTLQVPKRGVAYSSNEILILARSFLQVAEDPIVGNDQTTGNFWNRIFIVHNKNVEKSNSVHGNKPNYTIIPTNRTLDSLKTQWYQKIQRAVSKFQGICDEIPPDSGEVENDPEMNLYYERLKDIFKKRAVAIKKNRGSTNTDPKSMDLYFDAYKFCKSHPKFAQVLEPQSGKKTKAGHKQRPSEANAKRPAGRDTAKKNRGQDMVLEKVSNEIRSSLGAAAAGTGTVTSEFLEELKEQFVVANENMESVAHAQLMAMAPSPVKRNYYETRTRAIALMESNKLRKLQLEQKELDLKEAELNLRQQAIERAKENTLPRLPEDTGGGDGDFSCCYPKCEWANGLSARDVIKLDECEAKGCKSGKKFHHVCQINYMSAHGIDAAVIKLCKDCAMDEICAI